MPILVQKYGGTSVGDAECVKRVAARILATQQQGYDVVVVVSAMGDYTDRLIDLARQVVEEPNDREMDMLLSTGEQVSIAVLAMALHSLGVEAVSMTGPQAGIMTDAVHTKAKITEVKPERVQENLDKGRVVIVAGFQGLTPTENIATLGRGGSDTTAVALAAALKAERCQIFTDVDGVYTADPRIVSDASKLKEIAFDEMLEMASLGAKVIQSRAVEFAKKHSVRLEVLSSFEDLPGTVIREEVQTMEDILVRGVAVHKEQAKVTVKHVADRPGVAAQLFRELSAAHINVDMIVQNVSEQMDTDISFTVTTDDLARTRKTLDTLVGDLGASGVEYDEDVAMVSIVGIGMRSHSGVAFKMFETLSEAGINIHMISTSEIRISVVITKERAEEAMLALHEAFELDQLEEQSKTES